MSALADRPQATPTDVYTAEVSRLTTSALAHSDPMVWQAALRRIAELNPLPQTAVPAELAESAPVLTITRGLPASGKTIKAIAWVAERPQHRARVNRDSLRAMMHGGRLGTPEQEAMVTTAQHTSIRHLIAGGIDVVADDTNLAVEAVDAFRQIAAETGARLVLWDLTDVSLEECVRRDAQRTPPSRVGEKVIRRLYEQHLAWPSG